LTITEKFENIREY